MLDDYLSWDTPWELYFHALIFIPIIQRLIFLGEPALKAIQIHGHHLKWIFERLREIPKGYSIAAKFTVGLLVPATIAVLRFIIFEPEDGVVEFFAGKVVDTTNSVVDKVMEMPNNYAGRWMVVNVAFGMAFHLMPIAFMFFLTTTYEWNL